MRVALGAAFGFLHRELASLLRQRTLVLLTILGPFLILFAFGAGYRDERLVLRSAFIGPDDEDYERLLEIHGAELSEFIDSRGYSSDQAAAERELEAGRIDAVVVFPSDPMADVLAGRRAEVRVIHDQLNPIQQVAIEFAVRIATDQVNQAVVEEILASAQDETEPYRDALATVDRRRTDVVTAGPGREQAVAELDQALAVLEEQTAVLEGLWGLYGEPAGQDELSDLRGQLDAAAAELAAVSGDGTGVGEDRFRALQQRLDAVVEASALVDSLDPAVLSRPFTSSTDTLTDADIDEIDFFGAAAAALLLQHLALSLGALTFVRDRAMGLLELLRVGPVGAGEALVGKLAAFTVVGAAVAAALLAALTGLLGVPLLGDPLWLAAVVGLLLLASIGLGFFVSLLSRSDTQAVQYAMLVLLASLFFSGFFLDHERFRTVVAAGARLLPVTTGISGLQDVMLRGAAPEPVDLITLAALAVGSLVGSHALLRRELRTT